jgi:hypothetical protein
VGGGVGGGGGQLGLVAWGLGFRAHMSTYLPFAFVRAFAAPYQPGTRRGSESRPAEVIRERRPAEGAGGITGLNFVRAGERDTRSGSARVQPSTNGNTRVCGVLCAATHRRGQVARARVCKHFRRAPIHQRPTNPWAAAEGHRADMTTH